jgi:hypothetical protein
MSFAGMWVSPQTFFLAAVGGKSKNLTDSEIIERQTNGGGNSCKLALVYQQQSLAQRENVS